MPVFAFAQIEEDEFQQEIESWIENNDASPDYQDLFDQTAFSQKRRISINHATYDDLSRFPFLSAAQIFAIINHRKIFGNFLSVYELQVIEELDDETIAKIIPFISIVQSPIERLRNYSLYEKPLQSEFISLYGERLERSKGFSLNNNTASSPYIGSPQRFVFKYKGSYKNRIFFGYSGEKDAGETFFRANNPYGFDFNSAYLMYKDDKGVIKNIVIGDFQAAFGQGLTFGSGLSFGKSAMITNVKRNQNGFRPYRSLNENDFLRGIGVTLHKGMLESSLFVARNRLDGTLSNSDSLEEAFFSSFGSTGLHRTSTEINNKNTIGRTMFGGNIGWRSNNFTVGYTYIHTRYDFAFAPKDIPYNRFRFNGSFNVNQGLDYSFLFKNILLFGEIASVSIAKGLSFVQGGLLSLGKNLEIAFVHRNIDRDFTFTYSTAFAESSTVSNERGTYIGLVWRPINKWSMNIYYDIFFHNWLKYRVDAPSDGHDVYAELQYTERKKFAVAARFRVRNKSFNYTPSGSHLNELNRTEKLQARLNVQYFLSPNLTIKSRVEWSRFLNSYSFLQSSYGSLAYFDITQQIPKSKSRISCRFVMFNVDSYDARIYTFENDVLYSYSVPAFQNSGIRVYLLAKTRLYKGVDLWIKVARTKYNNIETISSGLDQLPANIATDIKCQLRWSF